MGKFDWGRFGSALATNVGQQLQQYSMNKALQDEEDKRAYTKSLVERYTSTGDPTTLEELGKINTSYAKALYNVYKKSPVKTPEQRFEEETRMGINRDLTRQMFGADPRPQPPKKSALETKLSLLDTPEGRKKLEALAEIGNTLSVKDKLYLKNLGLDIQIKTRKLSGEEPLSVTEAGALNVPLGTTRKDAGGKKALTADERNAKRILDDATVQIEQMAKLVLGDEEKDEPGLMSAQPGLDAWAKGVRTWAGSTTKTNVNAARYESKRKAYASAIAQLHGEVRPTDVDIERFLPMLPTFTDPLPLAKAKINDMLKMIDDRRNNITGFSEELKKNMNKQQTKDPTQMSEAELKARLKSIKQKYGY